MLGRPVRLVIASPHEIVAQGLRSMLAPQSHRVVVVDRSLDHDVDVVLHDGIGGADPAMLRHLARPCGVAVLVLADVADGTATRRPLVPGAVGWVPLRAGAEQIVALIEAAASGELALTEMVGELDRPGLSAREVEVLGLIALGLTNKDIAEQMFISINSVKTYIRSGYRKIGVSSRSQAVAWCIQHGVWSGRREQLS